MPAFQGDVAVYGHLTANIGLGTAARGTISALQAAGIALHAYDLDLIAAGRAPAADDARPHAVSIVHTNPDQVAHLLRRRGPEEISRIFDQRYTIGCWVWESTVGLPPRAHDLVRAFNEIWAPSRFAAHSLSLKLPCQVIEMPHALSAAPPPAVRRADLHLPEHTFLFLTVFDQLSNLTRKNPVGAILAFRRAFPDPAGCAALVVKARTLSAAGLAHLEEAAEGRPDVLLRVGDEPAEQILGLISACDAFVSLHRAEGFGLAIAEAMLLEKPVVATGYSGNMDFTTEANSLLVRWRPETLETADGYYPAGTTWADPDLDHAAELMRRVADDPAFGRRLGLRAASDLRQSLSLEIVGRRMAERLEAIFRHWKQPPRRNFRIRPNR